MILDLDKTTWKRVKFGDVVKNINDYFSPETDGVLPYVAGPHIDPESMCVRAYGKTSDDNFPPTFKRKFQPGDVLLHSRGIEKIAATDCQGVTGEKLFVLRAIDSDLLDQRFLPILLRSPLAAEYLENHFTGSVNRFLNWKPLAAWEFDLPPLDQQKRIVDLLWAVERHSQSVRLIIEASIPCQALAMDVSADGYVELSDVLSVAKSGGTPRRSNQENYLGNIPWLKSGEVVGGRITSTEELISDTGLSSSAAWLAPEGATVVAMYGDGKTRGQVGRLATPMATNQAVLALVADREKADSRFLYFWLRSRQSELRERGAGAAQKNLSKKIVLSEPFPDISIVDQLYAAERVETIDKSTDAQKAELDHLRALRTSLMSSIFGDS